MAVTSVPRHEGLRATLSRLGGSLAPDTTIVLLGTTLVVAACSFVYEMLIGTLSAYLLGNSVYHFSITIGLFMSALGIGAFVSRFVRVRLLDWLVGIEIAIALAGGFSAFALFAVFGLDSRLYSWALVGVTLLVGGLSGLEVPILTRLIRERAPLRRAVADVLSVDYLGALLAAFVFPLVLLPFYGVIRTALLTGLFNLAVAAVALFVFRRSVAVLGHGLGLSASALLLIVGLVQTESWSSLVEQRLYRDEIIQTVQSPYQRLVVTRWRDDLRLYLDGNLQFSSVDEYRYHESLVHPAMTLAPSRERVLVLGGGDGLALREILKYPSVQAVTVVDLDSAVTDLARSFPPVRDLNQQSLHDRRVSVLNGDAFTFLEATTERYPVIIVDMPDPRTPDLAKLFSVEFYRLAARHLSPGGFLAVQATSPYYARDAFWSVARSLETAGLRVKPYHVLVPTFGEWGFVLASNLSIPDQPVRPEVPVRFADESTIARSFVFEPDLRDRGVQASTLDGQQILNYYSQAWREWRGR